MSAEKSDTVWDDCWDDSAAFANASGECAEKSGMGKAKAILFGLRKQTLSLPKLMLLITLPYKYIYMKLVNQM